MTETQWLACEDPGPMLEFLRGKTSDRKLRLFACACVRRLSCSNGEYRTAVSVSEHFADGKASKKELNRTRATFGPLARNSSDWVARTAIRAALDRVARRAAKLAADYAGDYFYRHAPGREIHGGPDPRLAHAAERKIQSAILKDILDCPFRSIRVNPIWLTSTVSKLAEAIYEDRFFDRLPILADALEDAGCANADILNHCRGPGPHVRGCWGIDLLLGKE